MKIEGASALVAGGASGLGAATVRALHERGASVVIADMNGEKGEALASELGENAAFMEANVMEPEPVQAAVEAAADAPGGLRISVCCAGIGWAQRTSSKQGPHDLEIFHNVIKVNLVGTFNVLRLACAAMSDNEPDGEGERGVCINTASIAAWDGQIGQVAYAASKGGVVGLTLPAARDMAGRGVRVNTIAPGLFDTPLLGALPEEQRQALGRGHPLPAAPRPARGVRPARLPDRREHDAERRGDPAGRRAQDAAALERASRSSRTRKKPQVASATSIRLEKSRMNQKMLPCPAWSL